MTGKKIKLGKTPYGTKWHIIRDDGVPLCGYMSYTWTNGVETKEVPNTKLRNMNLCANCRRRWNSR